MNDPLIEIQSLPGIKGVVKCSHNGKLLGLTGDFSTFDTSMFDLDQLPGLARIIDELRFEKHGLQFSFENLYIDIRIFAKGFIAIISDPAIDIIQLNKLVEKLQKNSEDEMKLFKIRK
ncbi:hypothetical protein GF337_12225 [candidate division KSB1 bacterium]|nr:hypothetical protein [candidate division KSB1 bacterium]